MKVFIGCFDIASILSGLAEGFRDAGHEVTTFVLERNKFYPDVQYDIVQEPFFKAKLNFQDKKIPGPVKAILQHTDNFTSRLALERITDDLIKAYDLFIFIWRPWLPEEKIFKRIKAANKKIVCLHVGSDVRHIAAYKQEFSEDVSLWERFFHEEDLNEKIKKIRLHELFADVIFSVPDQEGLAIRGYNHLHIPLKGMEKIGFQVPGREVPVIVHAPSRSGIKGTSIICKAVEKLQADGYRFEFRLLQNLPNRELLKELTNADILIDEILLHGPGVLSLEAMAAGCIVATRTLNVYKDIFNPPVININPENIYDQLKKLLDDPNKAHLAFKGKAYVEENNRPEKVAQQIISSLVREHQQYTPDFYLRLFELPQGVVLSRENLEMSAKVAGRFFKGDPAVVKNAVRRGLMNSY
ncbi:glycosyltransferase family protein [Adhaeribacter soli]|uniref:Glycosyltransferase family 4 protein n=1 Tax=Adhaeribacter soli TaxID=2607655 RepID=A0A5N1IL36_9BACT|nr:glycosyltransferase family 4 protein [Adhaeribacter soli]KAA9327402.1 glycosyltransferase family 4 protein [Adhaeribacter soli]